MRSTEASVFHRPAREEYRFLPEGPREMAVEGQPSLVWVNIQDGTGATTGTIFCRGEEHPGSDFSVPCPGRPGFLLPADQGELALVGVERELRVLDCGRGRWQLPLVTIPDTNPRVIINDGNVLPGGKAIVFGTKDTQFKEPIAALYLYTVDDNRVSLLADKQLCSNGKVIRTESRGLVLYDIDTPTRKVARYLLDVAARTAILEGVAVDVADKPGFPDGMCDCGDDTVIIAFYNPELVAAGKAIRFDLTTGKPIEEWTTPGSPRVTCPLLVKRPDGVKLILTTATEGMPAEMRAKCPNAGCLFIADTQLATCPEPEFVRLA